LKIAQQQRSEITTGSIGTRELDCFAGPMHPREEALLVVLLSLLR
jgi:hypothetical protein